MSVESAKTFYTRINTDEAFQTQLRNASSEERTAIIRAAGYNFTLEEWKTATAEVLAAESVDWELNDAELEAVAGGVSGISELLNVMPSIGAVYGVALQPNLDWLPKGPSVPPPP